MKMMRSITFLRWLSPLILFLSACSEAPKTAQEKQPPKPPEVLTGRQAFQRMYPQARGWAPDAQPLEIRSVNLAQVKADQGKAGAWEGGFVLPSLWEAEKKTHFGLGGEGGP